MDINVSYPQVESENDLRKDTEQIEELRQLLFDITKNAVYVKFKKSKDWQDDNTVYFSSKEFSFGSSIFPSWFLCLTWWDRNSIIVRVNIRRNKFSPLLIEKDERFIEFLRKFTKSDVNILVSYR